MLCCILADQAKWTNLTFCAPIPIAVFTCEGDKRREKNGREGGGGGEEREKEVGGMERKGRGREEGQQREANASYMDTVSMYCH